MTVTRNQIRRLQDMAHELSVFADEVMREYDAVEDAAPGHRTLRSVADLRDDVEQARAEHHLLRDGA